MKFQVVSNMKTDLRETPVVKMDNAESKIKTHAEAILKWSCYKKETQQVSGKRIEPV